MTRNSHEKRRWNEISNEQGYKAWLMGALLIPNLEKCTNINTSSSNFRQLNLELLQSIFEHKPSTKLQTCPMGQVTINSILFEKYSNSDSFNRINLRVEKLLESESAAYILEQINLHYVYLT